MRTALAGLTTRARCLIAAGAAAALCAFILGQRDLMRAAVLLLILPLIAALVVARTRFQLTTRRSVAPSPSGAGEPVDVDLTLCNTSPLTSSTLLIEDDASHALGGRTRFVLPTLHAAEERTVRYQLRPAMRGRYRLGPLRLHVSDAFGLVELTRRFADEATITVHPAVVSLPAIMVGGAWGTGAAGRSRSVAIRGEDDVATREYRYGDDLRKVHWKSTARIGELMVRREERPWQARAALLLDARAIAHRGESPVSSLEWAVSAVASIGVHLVRAGFELDMLTDEGAVPALPMALSQHHYRDGTEEHRLLEWLTDLRASHQRDLAAVAPTVHGVERDATLVAVLGHLTPAAANAIAASRVGAAPSLAILLDTGTWAGRGSASTTTERARDDQVRAEFADAGWRVVRAGRGSDLAVVWSQLGAVTVATDVLAVPAR